MCLWQKVVKNYAYSCQYSEENHYLETTADAGVNYLRWHHRCDRPEHLYEGNSHNPDLSGVELIEVDCVVVEGIANCELNEEEE